MKKQSLNKKETEALQEAVECIDMAYTTDEVTKCVAGRLKCSIESAKGYLGILCKKGYIQKERYKDMGIGWIEQFSIVD